MKSDLLKQSFSVLLLVILLILLINPMHFWMPSMAHELMIGGIILLVCLYCAFVLREKVGDERDALHRMFAARVGFIAGIVTLTLGIFVKERRDETDVWLILTLVVMVLGKLAARFYSDRNL